MLRFKVDENLPREVAALLIAHGHDATTVHEQGHSGAADADLSKVCRSEGRVIVTLDLDFANIRVYPPNEHPGIIVLRLERQDKGAVLSVLTGLIPPAVHRALEREALDRRTRSGAHMEALTRAQWKSLSGRSGSRRGRFAYASPLPGSV